MQNFYFRIGFNFQIKKLKKTSQFYILNKLRGRLLIVEHMSDQEQLLTPLSKDDGTKENVTEENKNDIQTYEYRIPRIPAYSAFLQYHIYLYTTPYWISEFLIFIVKDNLARNGVSSADWVILFFWLIAQTLSRYLGIQSIKQGTCSLLSYFLYYVLIAILSIFFTIYLMALANTILLFEIIFSVITVILQCILFLGTCISFIIQISPSKVKTN